MSTSEIDLNSLSKEQLRDLHARSGLMLKADSSPSTREGSKETLLFEAIVAVCKDNGLPVRPFRIFAKNPAIAGQWKEKVPAVIRWIEESFGPRSRAESFRAYRIAVEALVGHLSRVSVALRGPTSIVRNLHKIPETVDREFPGYARSGLLGLVLRMTEPA